MTRIEELEQELKDWEATEVKHHGDGSTYLAGICQGNIDAFTVALAIAKRPSNTKLNPKQANDCEFCKNSRLLNFSKCLDCGKVFPPEG